MKNMKSYKLILLVTVISLIFGAMVGIGTSAEADAAVTVDSANLAYNEMMHLAVTLECTEELADGASLGLVIWDDTVEGDLTLANATYVTYTEKEDENGVKYFTSYGIPAPKMADALRIAGCIKEADGTVKLGDVISYSIYDYLNDRIATEGITPEQLDLYKKTLAYGKAAGAVFAD